MSKPSKKRKPTTGKTSSIPHVWALMHEGFIGGTGRDVVWCRFPVDFERDGKLSLISIDQWVDPFLQNGPRMIDAWMNPGWSWFVPVADLSHGANDPVDDGHTTFFSQPWPIGNTLRDAAVLASAYGAWEDHMKEQELA